MSIIELMDKFEIRIYTGDVASGECEVYDGERSSEEVVKRLKKERKGGKRWARAVAVMDGLGMDVETGEKIELVECNGDELKNAFTLVARHRGKASKGKPKTKRVYQL